MSKKKKDLSHLDGLRVKVKGDAFVLRKFSFRDIKPLASILMNEQNMAFLAKPFSPSEVEDRVVRNFQRYMQFGIGQMAIVREKDNLVIGDAGIRQAIIADNLENQLEIILDQEFWRQGIASQIGATLMHLVPLLGLERIACHCPSDQVPAIALATKLGFEQESSYQNPRHREKEYIIFAWKP